jgi:hypothetical protein
VPDYDNHHENPPVESLPQKPEEERRLIAENESLRAQVGLERIKTHDARKLLTEVSEALTHEKERTKDGESVLWKCKETCLKCRIIKA